MTSEKPGQGNTDGKGNGHGPKPITVYVNTTAHRVAKDDLSYEDVVKLAYPDEPIGNNPGYTVLYQRAHGNKNGELVAGQSVKAKDGMSFDVTPTNLS